MPNHRFPSADCASHMAKALQCTWEHRIPTEQGFDMCDGYAETKMKSGRGFSG